MYAVVDIAGSQFRIAEKDIITVPFLSGDAGSKLEFDRVLLIAGGKETMVGQPLVKGAKVKASVLSHEKNKKVTVFKKKRRKGYKVTKGHRQPVTVIQIDKITAQAKETKSKESQAKESKVNEPKVKESKTQKVKVKESESNGA